MLTEYLWEIRSELHSGNVVIGPMFQVRLLTLRILSMFPIDMQAAAPDSENQNEEEPLVRDSVFTICLKSEEQPATLNNYRYDDTLLGFLPTDATISFCEISTTLTVDSGDENPGNATYQITLQNISVLSQHMQSCCR